MDLAIINQNPERRNSGWGLAVRRASGRRGGVEGVSRQCRTTPPTFSKRTVHIAARRCAALGERGLRVPYVRPIRSGVFPPSLCLLFHHLNPLPYSISIFSTLFTRHRPSADEEKKSFKRCRAVGGAGFWLTVQSFFPAFETTKRKRRKANSKNGFWSFFSKIKRASGSFYQNVAYVYM